MGNIDCNRNVSATPRNRYESATTDRDAPARRIAREMSGVQPRHKSSSSNNKNKKSVCFINTTATVHYLHTIPLASSMAPDEKQRSWYTTDEYDQFKHDSANQAGVKVIRYDSGEAGRGHRFAVLGDFDGNGGAGTKNGTARNGAEDSSGSGGTKRHFYNENEYADSAGRDGKFVCKRGLGYHFSRSRKKSRAAARSAIVAWQRTLRGNAKQLDPKLENNIAATNGKLAANKEPPLDKSQMMLALVSTNCSRIAREEARWRGDVDFRIAYPKLHDVDHTTLKNNRMQHSRKIHNKRTVTPPVAKETKRRNDAVLDTGIVHDNKNKNYSKRQRTASSGACCGSSRGNGSDRDELAQATVGYHFDGMLQAEV